MIAEIRRVAAGLRMLLSRGRIVRTTLNAKRAYVQLNALSDELKDKIELMLPYGQSAYPPAGGDVVLLQVGGSRQHLIALCADDPALRIADLQEGEFGFRDKNGQQIVFRKDKIEITTPKDVVGNVTGNVTLTIGGNLSATVSGATTLHSTGNVTVTCPTLQLNGNLSVAGKIDATGEVTSSLGGTHTLTQHKHSGVTIGTGVTGTPSG